MANVAFGKRVVESEVRHPEAATDGVRTGYTSGQGYAAFDWPGTLTIDLEAEHQLKWIRVLLWDGMGQPGNVPDERRYRYSLLTSTDSRTWTPQYESGNEGSSGWQVFHAPAPITARYIRVNGVHNTANKKFHIVELEAHDDDPPALGVPVSLQHVIPPGAKVPFDVHEPRLPQRNMRLRSNTVLDSYRLVRRLGSGYSSEVWLARVIRQPVDVKVSVDQDVAVKVYEPAVLTGTQYLRIQREFTATSEINHPNVAKVFDAVISPSRPWHVFLVMEYLEGSTLKDMVRDGPLDTKLILLIGSQLFSALEELHSFGAQHRDVKPANVMLLDGPETQIKLLDFGIISVDFEDALTDWE